MTAKGQVFINAVILYSLTYDAVNVIDDEHFATALVSQIQISVIIVMVRKPSMEPIVLAKQWGIILKKAQKTIQDSTEREIKSMLHPSFPDESS